MPENPAQSINNKPLVLIVEDEPSIAESLEFVLQNEGFSTRWENHAGAALHYLSHNTVALVILDIGLPDMTGLEACKQLRAYSDVPVMFLTARGDEIDRIVGLEIGADDYVVKPFSPREVAARVKAILKRISPTNTDTSQSIKDTTVTAHFELDDASKVISFFSQPLQLTKLEYSLLQTLLTHPGKVYSRHQLLDALNISSDANYERSIDSHIKGIRAKLREINPASTPIKTQRGFGYLYQPD